MDCDHMYENFFLDTELIGIQSHQPPHILLWHINRIFDFSFELNPNLRIEYKKKAVIYFFYVYQYEEVFSSSKHFIYSLKSNGLSLAKELKNLDYLWMVRKENPMLNPANFLLELIKDIDCDIINWASVLDNGKIISKQQLYLDL